MSLEVTFDVFSFNTATAPVLHLPAVLAINIISKDHLILFNEYFRYYTDNIDAMDQRYLLTCRNPYDTMKVGGVFQYGLKSLQYDCDRR